MLGKPSRRMWVAALVVSVICVAALAYGLVAEWDTEPARRLAPAEQTAARGGGFGIGVVVGLGAGVVLGSLLALRKR